MPPRFAYWTIIAGGLPTSFRAAERDELLPTFNRIREKQPDAEMKYFARGKLWSSADEARAARPDRLSEHPRGGGAARERRGRDWRPGGEHRDPRQPFKDAKKARNQDRRQQRWERKTRDGKPTERGAGGPGAREGRPPERGWRERPGHRERPPHQDRLDRPPQQDWRSRPPQQDWRSRPPKKDWRDRPPKKEWRERPPKPGWQDRPQVDRREARGDRTPQRPGPARPGPAPAWKKRPFERGTPHGKAESREGRHFDKPKGRPFEKAPRPKPHGDKLGGSAAPRPPRREFRPKGGHRFERNEERPPRPRGPDREPPPGQNPPPEPPPRPSEPAIKPPGPPERGTESNRGGTRHKRRPE